MTTKDTRRGLRRWARRLVVPAALAATYFTVRDRLPGPAAVWDVLTTVDTRWIIFALAAQVLSMTMFARQQSWLLKGVGVHVPLHRALAVAYSRSAIAISMPAGTALSAAFAFKSYRKWGADREAATAVMVLSGLYSFAGLALLWLLGFLLTFGSRPGEAWETDPVGATVALLAIAGIAAFATWRVLPHRPPPSLTPPTTPEPTTLPTATGPARLSAAPPTITPLPTASALAAASGPGEGPGAFAMSAAGAVLTSRGDAAAVPGGAAAAAVPGRFGASMRGWRGPLVKPWAVGGGVRQGMRTVGGALAVAGTMGTRYRLGALGFSVINWLADIVCLVAMTRAVQLPLPFLTLGAIYVVVQIVRQIPLTPGGMGVIEASLLAGLTAAGASQAPAAVAVLGYRILSCWLLIPVGLLLWMWLRQTDQQ